MKIFFQKNIGAVLCVGMSLAMLINIQRVNAQPTSTSWLSMQVNKHPDIIAAKEEMNAVFSNAEGNKQPLYNPELETGYEREGDGNNYSIGVSQTIDWWDKRETKEQQANFSLTQASKHFDFLVQEKTAQALQALVTWQAAKKQAVIAQEQEKQLETLLDLVKERQKAGDLGQVDAELTFLSLSQMLNVTAKAQVQLKQAEAQTKELLRDWTPNKEVLPAQGLTITNIQISPQWLEQHPLVLAAKAQWQITKSEAQLALLETKADPTIGMNIGKNQRENVLGVTFSMPLNIRNNFSAQARAANQQALAAEANFRSVMRKQQFAIQSSTDTLVTYQKSYQRWQQLMGGRGKRSGDLLQKQWQSGDVSTTEYLLALQQRAEGLNAGIELQSQFQLNQINWLLQVGQIKAALQQLSQP
ncbi:TolC family protein [Paraglaciecola arctica]|uniref:Efflux family outer membrane protein n=1 Tax=Paraglaciecola arctica BSs20135 TaxID=493475 RepID=K6Y6B4_9ALTE|nr:TolC family protein [Paraglaciecola arctica]GAC19506.1 efflux family outer membrane protein [Paraglaciecola arctica BSs20135]